MIFSPFYIFLDILSPTAQEDDVGVAVGVHGHAHHGVPRDGAERGAEEQGGQRLDAVGTVDHVGRHFLRVHACNTGAFRVGV